MKVWAGELVEFPFPLARQVVREICRLHDGDFPPPASRFRKAIQGKLVREEPKALPEPPMPREEFREGMRQVLQVLEGGSGPLAGDLKRAAGKLG